MSAKTSAQQGRRTPLTLSGSVPKNQQQQQFNKPSTGSSSSNSGAKNDNKITKDQKTDSSAAIAAVASTAEIKDTIQKDTKKQTNNEKKQQQNIAENTKKAEKNEEKKNQNGVGKGNAKDKQQQQQQQLNQKNGTDNDNQVKEKKDKSEKTEKNDKPVKVVEKLDNREEKEVNDVVVVKEKEHAEKKQQEKAKKLDLETSVEKKKLENMDVCVVEEKVTTPKKPTIEKKSATPTKPVATVEKVTPSKITTKVASKVTPVKATTILTDDVEMEPLAVDPSPIKVKPVVVESITTTVPAATSTPGKILKFKPAAAKSEVLLSGSGRSPDRSACPRNFAEISGRRSIRPISEYTPSMFQSNAQFRESYRRINTELDVTSTTNTSLNVTVGSEVPNNSSFSFFGRGRKRDRTPPNSQSTMDLNADGGVEYSPPKRARLDMHGFFSAVASPLSLLRSRFSKTSIQSSTPVKLCSKLAAEEEEEGEVQNVSGVSIEEELPNAAGAGAEELTATEDVTVAIEEPKQDNVSSLEKDCDGEINAADGKDDAKQLKIEKRALEKATSSDAIAGDNTDDIKITETPLGGTLTDPLAKNKRCSIM